jgi:hypothetical protein
MRALGLGLGAACPDAYRRPQVQYILLFTSVCDQTGLSRPRLQGAAQQLVAWRRLVGIGMQPDLEEVGRLVRRRIAFSVADAGAGADELHVAGMEQSSMAGRVGMFERAGQHERQDVEVIVRMLRKSGPTCDHVLVDDPQGPEAHSGRVIEAAERERVVRVEPTGLGSASRMPVMKDICHSPTPRRCAKHGRVARTAQCKPLVDR